MRLLLLVLLPLPGPAASVFSPLPPLSAVQVLSRICCCAAHKHFS